MIVEAIALSFWGDLTLIVTILMFFLFYNLFTNKFIDNAFVALIVAAIVTFILSAYPSMLWLSFIVLFMGKAFGRINFKEW